MFNPVNKPTSSPWGAIQDAEQVFAGVWQVSTASHGGFYLSAERREAMPQKYIQASFNGQGRTGWFEEDCDWSLVCLSFPEEWREWRGEKADRDFEHARRTLEYYKDFAA
jgi:hypothetical protein